MKKCLILFSILVALLIIASAMEIEETSEKQQIVNVDDYGNMENIKLDLASE